MIETIGKIKLDYGRYSGEDLYCDGEVEDELLEIVSREAPSEYARVIEERRSWPILYHLSPLRENIVEWIPVKKSDKVLEVGSGCGAITGALARRAEHVTCVDLSKKRSLINAYRHSEYENVTIQVGNFKDIERGLQEEFNYIFLIGVFEYGQSYIGGKSPFEDFLKLLTPHLARDGRIVIAIENKYGMKYFAGCREDHLGTYFSGIENYAEGGGVRTFSRRGLEKIFKRCGLKDFSFYYPYPDYKFMTNLYSDDYLPGKGELSENLRNFDRDRMLLFDEKNAFDGVVEDGLFSVFANSYLVVLGKPFDVKYVKYSNDRAPEYCVRTEISKSVGGKRVVRKYPIGPAAREHVRGMGLAYENLLERYRDGELEINQCKVVEQEGELYAEFEFVQGVSLAELMDACLEKDDINGFHQYFREYVERTGYNGDFPVSDFDMIFDNILVDDEGKWILIDYEWTFGKQMDIRELAYRAVYCYLLESEKREKLNVDLVLQRFGITEGEAESFQAQERDFQKFVTGNRLSMAELRDYIGNRVTTPQKWIDRYQDSGETGRVQVYEDRGEGFSEENSYFIREAYRSENKIELDLTVSGDVQVLRIDPAFTSCIVRIEEISFNGENLPYDKKRLLQVNGRVAKPATLVFPTEDPNINIYLNEVNRLHVNRLYVRMEIVPVSLNMAREMANAVKKLL